MIDNPNPRNFYSEKEMKARKTYIPVLKQNLLNKIKDLTNKIENEVPFPHGNINLDNLGDIDDAIEEVLNNWYY